MSLWYGLETKDLLCGRQEQHGTLLLFQSKHFQIPGGHLRKFLQCLLRLLMASLA